jgi:DNA-binding PadR family transcriptional regulator
MNETARILCALSADNPTPVKSFCESLANGPTWNRLFHMLEALESQELVRITREGRDMKTLQLTRLGAERAREARETHP